MASCSWRGRWRPIRPAAWCRRRARCSGEIDRLLEAAGTSKERIVSATVYLADINTFGEMNHAWDAWVATDAKPARATIEAKLAAPEYRVEIQVTALL